MRNIICLLSLCVIFAACKKERETSATGQVAVFNGKDAMRTAGTSDSDQAFIPIDTANRMIKSYLSSINYPANDSEMRSMVIDADALRSYLNSPAGQNISQMKIVFAHNLKYINSGGYGQRASLKSDAITFVLAGYTDDGVYVSYYNNRVPDHATPCPASCPTIGAAASNLIQ